MVGAEIADDVDADGEEFAAFAERQFAGEFYCAAVIIGQKTFRAAAGPADRSTEFFGGKHDRGVFRIRRAADAETAADIAHVMPHLFRRVTSETGKAVCKSGTLA